MQKQSKPFRRNVFLPSWQGLARTIIGAGISLAVILWLATALDLRQVLHALRSVNYGWVALGLLMILLNLWAKGRRWHLLLHSSHISMSGVFKALILGQLFNQVLPARLGDLARAHLIVQEGYTSRTQALSTVMLEKLWDVITLVALVFGLTFWQPLPQWVTVPARLLAAGGLIIWVGMFILLFFRRNLAAYWFQFSHWAKFAWRYPQAVGRVGQMASRLLDGLGSLRNPQIMLRAGSWSFLAWFFGAMTNLVLFKAFNLPFSIGIAFFLLVVLHMGVAVPSVPGRFGIFEGLCLAALSLFGIDLNLALVYGVVLHALVLLPPTVMGLWWLLQLDSATRRAILMLKPA